MYNPGFGVATSFWYQSSTACRKPLLLVDVEFSSCENYIKPKMSYENFLGFFLLLN